MGWYRRSSRFISDAHRRYSWKISVPRNPVSLNTSFVRPNSRNSPLSQPLFRNFILQNVLKNNKRNSPFLHVAKRFCHVDRNKVEHFKTSGYNRWSRNPDYEDAIFLCLFVLVITVYHYTLDTVPFTERSHVIFMPSSLEKQLGEAEFKKMKLQFKGNILPPLHPESIRILKISQEIVEALYKGLRKEQVWSGISYSPESAMLPQEAHEQETMKAFSDKSVKQAEEERWIGEEKWNKEDEILDDQWVQQSRKKGQETGVKSKTSHLEGLKWEVIVVKHPLVNAFCLPGGKIVVFTGLLNHFKSDAEIATIIGHEVGHAVARHSAEQYTEKVTVKQWIDHQFFPPDDVSTMTNLLIRLPFIRRLEMEADYIGLLLIATAGYDPRVAPQVYEKLERIGDSVPLHDYVTTHPSGKKRAKLLSDAKVMDEALSIYRDREVLAPRRIHAFP